jgi:hypothetical protein
MLDGAIGWIDFPATTVAALAIKLILFQGSASWTLRFSRKLLFMGGIVLIAQSFGLPGEGKRHSIQHLATYTPLQRLALLGHANPHTQLILEQYSCFLRMISSPVNRQLLDRLQPLHAHREPLYREFRTLGKAFSANLQLWLQAQYPEHPIHNALLF